VPPDTTLAALEPLAGLPVVIWAVHRQERLAEGFDHAAVTSEGATVGAPMLTSTLVRAGRAFELVLGRLEDASVLDRLRALLQAAAAARRVARSRLGRVGRPLPGYSCVDADDSRLRAATGITPVAIDPVEVQELYRAVDRRRITELERETRSAYEVAPEAEGAVLERSLRVACALEDLVARHALDAAAMNCHVPEIRFGDEIGIAPCYGLGRLTSRGVPWSCVGDVLTAFAMLVLKLLGAAAQYHELESLDHETGELVIASSGEHDLAFGDGRRPRLVKNRWFEHDPLTGACACFAARPGPATLVGFAQLDCPPRYRLIAARGELTARSFPATGTANGAFRFTAGPAADAWERWCRAGVNHHSAATPGDYAAQVETVARFLGVEAVAV
jgi:L-arabinose isomerase